MPPRMPKGSIGFRWGSEGRDDQGQQARADRQVTTGREAQVCLSHSVAVALLLGRAGPGEYTDALVNDPSVRRIGDRVVRVLRDYDASLVEEVYSDGLLNMMDVPEFAEGAKLRRVFSALENRSYLASLLSSVADAGTVRVFIGTENVPPEMRDVDRKSVV